MMKKSEKISRFAQSLAARAVPMMIISFVLVGVLFPDTAFAASDELDKALLKLQQTINVGFGLVHATFWPILLMIGSLMDNDLIFGPGIGERLREIWVIMRNIVNIAFVFLLLVVAFYNVTGLGGEGNFALKTVLPKFVLALVAVNFSFLACKIILDAANVVSMAVYDITGSIEDYDASEIKSQMEYMLCNDPTTISNTGAGTTVTTASSASSSGTDSAAAAESSSSEGWSYKNANPISKAFCCSSNTEGDETCTTTGETPQTITASKADTEDERKIFGAFNDAGKSFFRQVDQNNIGIIMAINLGSLNHLTEVASSKTGVGIKDLPINTLFSILMYVVFGFAYVALFIVLLARLVVLWFVIALSPLIALTMVVPQINQYASELNLTEKFMQHLIAPIIIGLSMSIGYLLTDKIKSEGAAGIDIGGIGNSSVESLTDAGGAGTFLAPNVSDLQQLMIICIAVAVVWLGVFGAADKTIASSVTSPIKEFGTKAAKFLAKLPTYAPIVPIMTREGEQAKPYSFAEITGVLKTLTDKPEQWASDRRRNLEIELGITNPVTPEFEKLLQKYKASTGTKNDKAEVVKTMLGNIRTDADYKEFRDNVLTPAGINAPQTRDSFDNWYAGEGYKEFNKQLDPTSPFTGTEYTDKTGAKSGEMTQQQSIAQFNTLYSGSATGDTKEAKVGAAADKMIADKKVDNPAAKKTNLTELLTRVTNDDGSIDEAKMKRMRFDPQGRLMIAASLQQIPAPGQGGGSDDGGSGNPSDDNSAE